MDFITTTKPLKARVKQRYSDFIVEEIYEENGEEKRCEVNWFVKDFTERNLAKLEIPEKKEEQEQLIIELEKINTDTNTAIALISRGIGVSGKRIGYAGLKDKRGITCQRMSIFEPIIEKVARFGVKGLKIKSAKWGERLELGDLKGNEFVIVLRNIEEDKEEIKKIVDDFAEQAKNGIPNFFGTQRFGGKRLITHKVGKLLLSEKYKEAITLYLTSTYEEEKEDLKNARINLAKTMDFATALREFPRDTRPELALLNHLVKKPNDFAGALGCLPKKTRYLFIHAYQSWLFNKIIEKRLELFKEKALLPIDGDELEEGIPAAILPGFESTFAKGKAGEIEKEIMEEEGTTFENFKVGGMSELSSKGSRKAISVIPEKFELLEIFDDEFNEGKRAVKIKFFLTKGNYATTILRELVKEEIF
jgi:tRNA pseudouridine13 synthase